MHHLTPGPNTSLHDMQDTIYRSGKKIRLYVSSAFSFAYACVYIIRQKRATKQLSVLLTMKRTCFKATKAALI